MIIKMVVQSKAKQIRRVLIYRYRGCSCSIWSKIIIQQWKCRKYQPYTYWECFRYLIVILSVCRCNNLFCEYKYIRMRRASVVFLSNKDLGHEPGICSFPALHRKPRAFASH